MIISGKLFTILIINWFIFGA